MNGDAAWQRDPKLCAASEKNPDGGYSDCLLDREKGRKFCWRHAPPSIKLTAPHGFMVGPKPKRVQPGRALALFLAGASVAELARAFGVLESDIEAALRKHVLRVGRSGAR